MEKKIYIEKDVSEKKIILGDGEECVVLLGGNTNLQFDAVLAGEGASLRVLGSFLGKENEEERITLRITHAAPRTKSFVRVRSALYGQSSSFFDGLIRMEDGAREASGVLSYRALLLSESVRARPIPRLEIIEKDVARAGHEVSVGKINQQELFYLQSRGMSSEGAEQMIVEGFLALKYA